MYVYVPYAYSAWESQKRESDSLELKLETVVCHSCGGLRTKPSSSGITSGDQQVPISNCWCIFFHLILHRLSVTGSIIIAPNFRDQKMEITDAILFVEVPNLSFEFQICLSNCNFVSTDLPLPKPVPCYWLCDAIFPVIQVKPLRVNPDISIPCINIPHPNLMGNLSPYFKVPR